MCRSQETSSSGEWTFPGGKIREGEKPEETVIRETKAPEKLEIE